MAGRFDDAESPYLRRASAQPVNWQRDLPAGRPALLVIGHFASHACAAFDDEVFDDPTVAREIDARMAAVRIDAEDRPDLDARFQWLAQDGGGWPLVCLLAADGTPRRVLGRLPRARLLPLLEEPLPGTPLEPSSAPLLAGEAGRALRNMVLESATTLPLREIALERAAEIAAALRQHGVGFTSPPRYPHVPALSLLLDQVGQDVEIALRMIEAFCHGGLQDHLAGGFHHCSTDSRWIVPHFEKHALDQAVILDVLGAREHAKVAREGILRYLRERLALPGGGYASSEAADVGAYDDGSYYTWTVDEARAALPDQTDFAIAQRYFDIFGKGELHSDPTRNVLFIAMSEVAVGRELSLATDEVKRRLPSIRAQLGAARDRRPRPLLDTTTYVASSARLARACVDRPENSAHALDTIALLATRPSRGWLGDEAQLGLAAFVAHRRSGDPAHLELAKACLARTRELLTAAPPWLARDTADVSPIALAARLQLVLGDTAGAVATVREHLPSAAVLGVHGAGLLWLAAMLPLLP